MTAESPTLRQRELGARMRELRNGRGWTVQDVGDKLLCSPTKISRMETGARRPSLRDVRDLCGLYGVDEATTKELMDLARQAREQEWWMRYDLHLGPRPYIALEQESKSITTYTMYHLPALLQTEDYAQAIIKAIAPKMSPEVLKDRVEARIRRQDLLDRRDPQRYRALLDEAVLHHQVGGPAIMEAQLAKILELQKAKKVTVQVIPFEAGAYASQDSNFVLFESDESFKSVVFVEGLITHQYQERPSEVERYRETLDRLRDVALSPSDSARRIAEVRETYVGKQ